jgi:hypothetical protein
MQVLLTILLSVLGLSVTQMVVAALSGTPSLPMAGPPKVEEYGLLKHEVERSKRFSPVGQSTWRFRDRPATVRFDDTRYAVTIRGESLSNGKPFEHTLTINQIVSLRDMLSRSKAQ